MPNFMKSLLISLTFAWAGSISASPITAADTVTANGRQWAQVDLFTNLTWNDIHSVCGFPATACGGTLNGYDMNGWHWAEPTDMEKLFNSYIPLLPLHRLDTYTEEDSSWAPAFFEDGWRSTSSDAQSTVITGYMYHSNYIFSGISLTGLVAMEDSHTSGNKDLATTLGEIFVRTDSLNQDAGAWFFREAPVHNVSSPTSLALISVALAALGLGCGKRREFS